MTEFIDGWTESVVPLRRQAGFEIVGAWATDDEFVWVLGYDGDFSAADAAYYASSARQRLDPDPAELIEASDERTVERVI